MREGITRHCDDERESRALGATWLEAGRAGDTENVLLLMTDDVVFLRPGHLSVGPASAGPTDTNHFFYAAGGLRNLSVMRSDSPIASYLVRSKFGSCASAPSL